MPNFMMLIRDEGTDFSKWSPQDFQNLLKKYSAWTKKLQSEGRLRAGEKLKDDRGKSLRVKNGKAVIEGPYAEAREAIGGFYIIAAKNMDEALGVAQECPAMSYGGSLEIREVD